MNEQLSFEEAKRLSIIKWEAHIKAGGFELTLPSELNDLDKEKVEKIAKKKAKELQRKAEDLVDLAKEKGTPVLEGIADDLKHKGLSVKADAQMSKPEVENLVNVIDKLIEKINNEN